MAMPQKVNIRQALKGRLAGQSYDQIAKAQGVAKPTVWAALQPILKNLPNAENVELFQKQQANIFDAVSCAIVSSISNEDLTKATLQQKATSIGILTDKARLVSGQSTANLGISVLLQGVSAAAQLHTAGDRSEVIDGEILVD